MTDNTAPDRTPKHSSGWTIVRAALLMLILPTALLLALKWLLGW